MFWISALRSEVHYLCKRPRARKTHVSRQNLSNRASACVNSWFWFIFRPWRTNLKSLLGSKERKLMPIYSFCVYPEYMNKKWYACNAVWKLIWSNILNGEIRFLILRCDIKLLELDPLTRNLCRYRGVVLLAFLLSGPDDFRLGHRTRGQ